MRQTRDVSPTSHCGHPPLPHPATHAGLVRCFSPPCPGTALSLCARRRWGSIRGTAPPCRGLRTSGPSWRSRSAREGRGVRAAACSKSAGWCRGARELRREVHQAVAPAPAPGRRASSKQQHQCEDRTAWQGFLGLLGHTSTTPHLHTSVGSEWCTEQFTCLPLDWRMARPFGEGNRRPMPLTIRKQGNGSGCSAAEETQMMVKEPYNNVPRFMSLGSCHALHSTT